MGKENRNKGGSLETNQLLTQLIEAQAQTNKLLADLVKAGQTVKEPETKTAKK